MTTVTGVPGVNISFSDEDDDSFVDLDDALGKLREAVEESQPDVLLLQGAKEGDLDKVKRALGNGAQVTATADNGDTVLHLAVRSGEVPVVRHLILQKADVNAEDGRGYSPLNLAADRGEEVIAGMLLSSGANPEHVIPKIKETPLITAAHKGCDKLVLRLITRRVNLDAADCNGVTAAMRAAGGDHAECLDLLKRAGADLSLTSKTGNDAEAFAARSKAQKSLRVLKALGDVQAELMNSCHDGHHHAVRAALKAGADVNAPDGEGRMALPLAVRAQKLQVLELLLEQKPDLNVSDDKNNTPLGIAIQVKNYRVAKMLLDLGASANRTTGFNNETPLMLACAINDDRFVDLLLTAGAQVDKQDALGRTALMNVPAARTDLMKQLLDLGAHPGVRDAGGRNYMDQLSARREAPAAVFLENYLRELDERVQEKGSLRAITPLKAIKVKMRVPGGEPS